MSPIRRDVVAGAGALAVLAAAALWARFATESRMVGWMTFGAGLGSLWFQRHRPLRERLIDPFLIAGLVALLHLSAARLGWIPPRE